MSALETIRILCLKISELNSLPKWRFIKKKLLQNQISKKYKDFESYSIYEKMSGLSVLVTQYYEKYPQYFNIEMLDMMKLDSKFMTIYLDNTDPFVGSITYIIESQEFDFDVIENDENKLNKQYAFKIYPNIEPMAKPKKIFNILIPSLDKKMNKIIQYISKVMDEAQKDFNSTGLAP